MTEPPESYRLFIALPVPETVRGAIGAAQTELRKLMPGAAVRWTPPAQFHLTLRFLEAVPCDRLETLTMALQAVCAKTAPLALRAKGIGCFPNSRRPRIIWAGLTSETGALEWLWRKIQTATSAFTSEPAEKQFVGHVTMGRIKFIEAHDRAMFLEKMDHLAWREFGEWRANRVELMRSELSSHGARHSCLADLPLAGSGAYGPEAA